MSIPRISLLELEQVYGRMREAGVEYGLGAKAELQYTNPNSTGRLSTPEHTIDRIDCSGFVRYAIYHATNGGLVFPDGSQIQREWCERQESRGEIRKVARYSDAAKYMTDKRLFICFIKPYTNGCGSVGHVWFLRQRNGKPMTVESHGGVGVNSRPWDHSTLLKQVYSVYELPTVEGKR